MLASRLLLTVNVSLQLSHQGEISLRPKPISSFGPDARDRDQRRGFHQRSFVYGHPPKVVWIQRGNGSTKDIEQILTIRFADILVFEADSESAFLSLR